MSWRNGIRRKFSGCGFLLRGASPNTLCGCRTEGIPMDLKQAMSKRRAIMLLGV